MYWQKGFDRYVLETELNKMNEHSIFNCTVKARHLKNHKPGTISHKTV